ncbi:hypothetical protein [Desulfobaculum sp.]
MSLDTGKNVEYTAQDPQAARRMASIAEKQDARADDLFNIYLDHFLPYEEQVVGANRDLLPQEQGLRSAELSSQSELLPLRTEAARLGLQEQMRDITEGRAVKDALRETQLSELEAAAPVTQQFYAEAAKGPDVAGAMGRASADVAQSFKDAGGAVRRSAARMGLTGGRTAALLADTGLDKARAMGGARTIAREQEKDRAFSKMTTAMQVRGRASGLPGTGDTGGMALAAMPHTRADMQRMPVHNAGDMALGLSSQAMAANNYGMQPVSVRTTGKGGGAGNAAGGAMGGAMIGTQIMPGWGTAIGAMGGAGLGLLGGS